MDLQLPVQSVPIAINVVSLNPVHIYDKILLKLDPRRFGLDRFHCNIIEWSNCDLEYVWMVINQIDVCFFCQL